MTTLEARAAERSTARFAVRASGEVGAGAEHGACDRLGGASVES
ncbi:MAG: hypothetical protein OXG81_03445 [Acidobacteria bacterium]|nr:hypothetical protein [Acidobacteriota bacterium]